MSLIITKGFGASQLVVTQGYGVDSTPIPGFIRKEKKKYPIFNFKDFDIKTDLFSIGIEDYKIGTDLNSYRTNDFDVYSDLHSTAENTYHINTELAMLTNRIKKNKPLLRNLRRERLLKNMRLLQKMDEI